MSLTLGIGLCFTLQGAEVSSDPLLNVSEVIVVHGKRGQTSDMATTHWRLSEDEIREIYQLQCLRGAPVTPRALRTCILRLKLGLSGQGMILMSFYLLYDDAIGRLRALPTAG
ncbi:hypothetical protein [Shewanella sp.]|uniref:hypothetical protein n=1 Tax=Shewanella sp. TaxID=50422 RepID=UPI003F3F05A2